MDRFIDYTYSVILRALKNLKSNMDRFIVALALPIGLAILFKIQYG